MHCLQAQNTLMFFEFAGLEEEGGAVPSRLRSTIYNYKVVKQDIS
jgi:hypothetical protein